MDPESAHVDEGGASRPPSSSPSAGERARFDKFAETYVAVHQRNVAVTGEPPAYFAAYKLGCIDRLVGPAFDQPVLDYGCGVGMVTERLSSRFTEVHGYDPSTASLVEAGQRVPGAHFHADLADIPDAHFGLIVMSCVLHHVDISERHSVMACAIRKLLPGQGRLVVFEHNPLNPLTRHAVSQCPFDDDARLLWPWEAASLLRRASLRDVRLRFIVFLPRALSRLRWIEPHLGAVPLGAQVMVVGRAAELPATPGGSGPG